MLVREEGNQLHLLSVLSPAWIGKGKTIAVRQAPTYFGPLDFTLTQPQTGQATLHLQAAFTTLPAAIVVHLPWFVDFESASVDGKPVHPTQGALTIPAGSRDLVLHWTVKAGTPQLSYDRAVAAYKAEYARRYQTLMHGDSAPMP